MKTLIFVQKSIIFLQLFTVFLFRNKSNKYLKLTGEVKIEIDYHKFEQDKNWDGLKGYLTNTKLSAEKIMAHYKNLWQIEKAFRISKTDLKIRPIYHRIRHRIEAHICIAFTAYAIHKELERILYKEKSPMSVGRASALTHNMYELCVTLLDTKERRNILLQMDKEQQFLHDLVSKNFQGSSLRKTGEKFLFLLFFLTSSLLQKRIGQLLFFIHT